jgi:hypothetical protein
MFEFPGSKINYLFELTHKTEYEFTFSKAYSSVFKTNLFPVFALPSAFHPAKG